MGVLVKALYVMFFKRKTWAASRKNGDGQLLQISEEREQRMKIIKLVLGILALAISMPALAFMPANGIWQIDSETNGQPGRGFTIDVENEVMFFTYYGYRQDGSSLFYVAAGPVVNNTFTADLLNVEGGTSLGGTYKPAALAASPGKVTLSFTSGKHGMMTLPGENQKAISKNSFGYADGPDGLLGTWLVTSTIGTSSFVERFVLNTKLGATTNGNGAVSSSTGKFVCEFQVSGSLAGMVMCANLLTTATLDGYLFQFSGDRGTGINLYQSSATPHEYESHTLRIATKTGTETGLNNGTAATVQIMSATNTLISKSADPAPIAVQAKDSVSASRTSSISNPEKAAALMAWEEEIGVLQAQKIK